ncbi:MAG: hypothetical protein ABIU11_03890 [Chitinophagaceae bacterium]
MPGIFINKLQRKQQMNSKAKMEHLNKIVLLLFIITGLFYCTSINAAGKENPPILIIGLPDHFDTYTGEILKAEGFNEFQIISPTDANLSSKYLKRFDIVILTEIGVTDSQKDVLITYVREGGNLIAFRPDKNIATIFGIKNKADTLSEAYISMDTFSEIGKGLIKETLQFHGTADLYQLDGGKKIASLYATNNVSTDYPAVAINNYGRGHAIAFMYNLPKSIVHTRQGNYLFAGQEKDSIDGIRAMDMFTNGWVDTSKNTINQADEQMRLLSHCIEYMSSYLKPLPRFWYFPDTLKCLVTFTNDGEDSKEAEFEPQFKDVDSKGAKMVLYIKETDLVSKKWVDNWSNRGFEIAGHFDDTKQARNPDWETMDSVIKDLKVKLKNKYGIDKINTVVNHWFVWCGKDLNGVSDFTAQAKLEVDNGIGMDINYAHYDNNSNHGHFLGAMGTGQGNFTGSGLVMKFADQSGKLVNIYQHLNNVYDQQYMDHKDSIGFYNCFKGLMDRSLNSEVYSYISVKAHNNEYYFSKTPLMSMLDHARDNGIPVWAPVKLLEFLKAKDEATFHNIKWENNGQLSFKIKSALKHSNELACMIPYLFNGKKISEITKDGRKQSYTVKQVKGFDYAFLTIKPGAAYSMVVKYSK